MNAIPSRTTRRAAPVRISVAVTAVFWTASCAHATEVTFSIDSEATSITLSEAYFNVLGVPLASQNPGVSDIGTLNGYITVDVDDLYNPTSIEFVGGYIEMLDNGEWLPAAGGGSPGDPGPAEPGSYGTKFVDAGVDISFYSAFRDVAFSLVMYDESDFGDPIVPDPIPVTDGSFPWDDPNSRVLVDVLEGYWDWNLGGSFGDDSGSETADNADNLNAPATNGTYSVGNIPTLTIPFYFRLGEDPDGDPSALLMVLEGVIVATTGDSCFLEASFDQDGDVDGDDFLIWQAGFGITEGATKMDGDADNDGDVDGDDFLYWQSEFGAQCGPVGTAAPEPASVALLVASILAWCGLRSVTSRPCQVAK